ncbi:baseplate J/gp47 family protein [Pasteurellaceae bacterium LIM206]|nr:baseplate J/gp47 family protein [Pasteurellaceae bacterium LIM206]
MSELVDLSALNAPDVLETLDFENLLSERKKQFIALFPADEQALWTQRLTLESEPVVKLLEENCYLQLLERKRINEAAKATMLAYATGADLDVIAANFNVKRLVIRAADNSVTPPIEEELESDSDLRLRAQLAFEGLSVAGPRNAYIYHALSAHGDIADVSVKSPSPANVTVTVLSKQGKGAAANDLLNIVAAKLNDENIRPIADRVSVQSAKIKDYQISAKLYSYKGPEIEVIKNTATEKLKEYVNQKHRLGRDISVSGIYAALHVEGVQRVELTQPNADIILSNDTAGYCTNINLSVVNSE